VRTIYDASNAVVSTLTGAARITYTVSVYLIRPISAATQTFIYTRNTFDGTFTQPTAPTTPHSPPVTGTFTLRIGGITIDPYTNGTLPYNAPASDIQNFLRKNIVGFQDV
jgi:hypothetical protein